MGAEIGIMCVVLPVITICLVMTMRIKLPRHNAEGIAGIFIDHNSMGGSDSSLISAH